MNYNSCCTVDNWEGASSSREGRKKMKRGWRLTWRWGSWRLDWWRTVRLEVVRPAAGSGRSWKKKKQRPAKDRGSSRLELLEWLRAELLPWLPLGRIKASRQGGCSCYCQGHGGKEEDFYRGEREVVQPPREMVWWLLEVGTIVRRQVMRVVVADGHDGDRKDQL